MWQVPLFDLNYDAREEDAVLEVIRSRWLTSGPQTARFEQLFSDYLGGGVRSLAVTNCTAALHLALLACGVGAGDEVIISGLSFVACLNVVSLIGAVPVLADCKSRDDWNVSPDEIARKITPRTKALLIVHFAGYPCDMEEIMQIASANNLRVIEDVAHAVGADYRGKKCGTMGDIGCFSFFSNKNLSTGEGGMLVTKDGALHDCLKLLRSHGMTSMTIERHDQKAISYDVVRPGLNYRFDEIRAALGIQQLFKLDASNLLRKAHVERYHALLGEAQGVQLPWRDPLCDRTSSYHIFPILLPKGHGRLALVESMRRDGVQTSMHYPAYQSFTCYAQLGQRVPTADEISSRVLTLPLYATMGSQAIDTVCDSLLRGLESC